MGVYKNVDARFQEAWMQADATKDEDLADVVRWYEQHFDKLPPELLRAILTDDAFFQKALTVWDNARFSPKPASEHVALQVSRRDLRVKRKPSMQCVIGWSLIALALTASAVILAVNL